VISEAGHPAEIAPGASGQFDVIVDGEIVFSKKQTGRFPEHGEILAVLP
jgi:selenoprotein W-related protein